MKTNLFLSLTCLGLASLVLSVVAQAADKPKMATEMPAGKENNWIQTVPGKGWNTLLRLYSPLEPWFNKTWRPGEIELVK
jgi:hypothetical protein